MVPSSFSWHWRHLFDTKDVTDPVAFTVTSATYLLYHYLSTSLDTVISPAGPLDTVTFPFASRDHGTFSFCITWHTVISPVPCPIYTQLPFLLHLITHSYLPCRSTLHTVTFPDNSLGTQLSSLPVQLTHIHLFSRSNWHVYLFRRSNWHTFTFSHGPTDTRLPFLPVQLTHVYLPRRSKWHTLDLSCSPNDAITFPAVQMTHLPFLPSKWHIYLSCGPIDTFTFPAVQLTHIYPLSYWPN